MNKEKRATGKGSATVKRAGFILLFTLYSFNF